MEDEEGTEYKRYLDIVQRHTERLINIVNDLLQLSELEQKGIIGNLEKIDLKDTVENVFRIFKQKAEKKNIRLILDTPDSVFFYGDPFKLEQMFVNLIDNAIKYTESGNVTVSLNIWDKRVIINVSDTGIGIPERHLDRIFERFYVVDKSRSRRVGGTGLGLSIVKHIVLLHNGKIKVWSKRGKGTTFTITLPMS
jgi:two-component system phosphate regulon sensor histidine kinase PhoR